MNPIIKLVLKEDEYIFDLGKIERIHYAKNKREILIQFSDNYTETIKFLEEETEKAYAFFKDTYTKMKNYNDIINKIRESGIIENL